jgi:RHH-type proline utilization regulon transcriptional repressor/proline dehydrogenase/delta 1-pyrroline-5-carboxylate dehydrogenase
MTIPIPFANFAPPIREADALRRRITAACRLPERACIEALLPQAELPAEAAEVVRGLAMRLATAIRARRRHPGIEALVQEYSLSSDEGTALMCLAEALLRIPDTATRDALIRDQTVDGDWKAHLGGEKPLFVNAATWGLIVTSKLAAPVNDRKLAAALRRLVGRAGEPVVRRGMRIAMRMLGEQFVTGETIEEALRNARTQEAKGFTYSFDMLGEAAATAEDAARYMADYEGAIHAIGKAAVGRDIYRSPGISIKLSALHPRYSRSQADRVMGELLLRVKSLAALAKLYGIGLNIDAEEADRLELSLDVFESLAMDPELASWDGLGFVVQAYGKRCPFVIDWLVDLARRSRRRIMVRLVKGAYWDTEIKRAQVDGLADFPVYTRKVHTDVAYIACARKLLEARSEIYPQFATHNAQTLATIHQLAGKGFWVGDYEFQCLHGMGEVLYEQVVGKRKLDRPCRIYAPVGTHDTLLAYLVRRLLENGANSSFVHRLADLSVPLDELVTDPATVVRAMAQPGEPHEGIALPAQLFPDRINSSGIDLADEAALTKLSVMLRDSAARHWEARPLIPDIQAIRTGRKVYNPADRDDLVGTAHFALPRDAQEAVRTALRAAPAWAQIAKGERAAMLERTAAAMQEAMPRLAGLVIREAGKSAANAISEVREAIDFLRYYGRQARELGAEQAPLGPVVCISPWNFPLAIFIGQVAAALATGNSVLAKPAEETPLIAAEGVRLLHEAGIPGDVLQFLPGGSDVGAALVKAPGIEGVMFTGSTAVARLIQQSLSLRVSALGKPIPLIAETGGINAMVVDSSALTEQVVHNAVLSAFDSAGQRCSALRLLCLQDDIAERTLAMLKGALRELRVGNPDRLVTDVGPVITSEARNAIENHVTAMEARGFAVTRPILPTEAERGTFVAPTIIEIDRIDDLEREVFGPVLHVLRFRREEQDRLIEGINATGYGLTFGLHTRLSSVIEKVGKHVRAGNVYINRNTIGAVVGVQPFGGHGLSGTGPKAGGPLYLQRLLGQPAELPSAEEDPALRNLIEWLDEQGRNGAARTAALYHRGAGVGLSLSLPGPVGESNRYKLRPRGCVLLKPQTDDGFVQQMSVALASGNSVAIEGYTLPNGLPASVARRIVADKAPRFASALIEGEAERVAVIAQELAARSEAIVTLQSATSQECAARSRAYCAHWLLEEVSTSIDITAAGGNASLLMIG